MLTKGKFATAISCIDGRVHLPIINWLMREYSVDYVDIISEPGVDGAFISYPSVVQDIKNKVSISVGKHGSDIIFVSAHHDCAGNSVSKEEHLEMLKKCVVDIRGWKLPIKYIISAWIDERWKINIIDRIVI